MGLAAHAHHRMYSALLENYIKDHYQGYKDDLQRAIKGNWIMSLAVGNLWLNRRTETINKFYSYLAVSFLMIAILLYAGLASPWSWPWPWLK
jgi:hypothetical protein